MLDRSKLNFQKVYNLAFCIFVQICYPLGITVSFPQFVSLFQLYVLPWTTKLLSSTSGTTLLWAAQKAFPSREEPFPDQRHAVSSANANLTPPVDCKIPGLSLKSDSTCILYGTRFHHPRVHFGPLLLSHSCQQWYQAQQAALPYSASVGENCLQDERMAPWIYIDLLFLSRGTLPGGHAVISNLNTS